MGIRAEITELQGQTRLSYTLSYDARVSKSHAHAIRQLCESVLPLEYYEKKGMWILEYDAGYCSSLAKHLNQTMVSHEQVIGLVEQVADAVLAIRAANVPMENIACEPDQVFLDPTSGRLRMICYPQDCSHIDNGSVESLVCWMIDHYESKATVRSDLLRELKLLCMNSRDTAASVKNFIGGLKPKPAPIEPQASELSPLVFLKKLFGKWQVIQTPEPTPPPPGQPEPIRLTQATDRALNGSEGTVVLIDGEPTEFLQPEAPVQVTLSVQTDGMVSQADIRQFPCVLGRSSKDAQFVIEDRNTSRRHAILDWKDGAPVISDCNSKNGVRLNGERIPAMEILPLQAGDVVRIGMTEITILEVRGS